MRNVVVFEKLDAKVFKSVFLSITIVISDCPVALVILVKELNNR